MKQLYETGDLVVINCNNDIVYTILSIYSEGRYAICSYCNKDGECMPDLSIPLIALTRYQEPAVAVYMNAAQPAMQMASPQA